jgi:cold shock CspA family protein
MSIWDRMNKVTKGISEEEEIPTTKIAKPGDVIQGTITNIVQGNVKKKGGYGFISSPSLPYERIFFHWSGLQQQTLRFPALKKRMKVEFQLQHDDFNGFRAIKIKVIE